MSESSNFPTVMPSLLLDFANAKQLDPRITFTRASTATYYDEDTVAKAEQNLLTYSQEFDNAAWENPGAYASITANTTTAPDGTLTADTMAQTAVTNYFLIQQNKTITANTTYVFSVYAKNVNIDYVAIELYGANSNFAYAEFNLTTGALNRSSATGTGWSLGSTSIQSVGAGGWYRISAVITVGTTVSSPRQRIFLTDGTTAISATTGLSVFAGTSLSAYLWGAQLEQRSAVTAYTVTTTQPITNYIPVLMTAAVGVPRFIFNPTTRESLGLLIEEQRTNLLTYSEQFDNAAWTKLASSISANNNVSPNGALNADNLVEGTTTGNHIALQNPIAVTSSTAYTFSAYCKPAGRTWVQLLENGGSGANAYFNLNTGATGTISGGTTAAITSIGNGWYRCAISFNTSVSQTVANVQIRIATANSTNSYTGDGYSGIFIWGAQLEAGAFPTSYIPTVASSVTRSADAASMTGVNFSQWYRADEGTLYLEGIANTTGYSASMNDNSSSNAITLVSGTSGTAFWVDVSGVSQAAIGTRSLSMRYAGAYKANDIAFSSAGGVVATDTTATIPVVSRLNIGTRAGGSGPISGTIKKIAYYPWRLTNAQLQALTS